MQKRLQYFANLLFLWLCIASGGAKAQTCPPNIDFEFGNFTNWQTYIGTVDSSGPVGTTNVITVAPSPVTNNRHTIISAATVPANDPYGGFPKLCPNGSAYCVRLGNNQTRAQAERISYTFTVPTTTNGYSIVYQYAVVLQDPSHPAYAQPRFTAKVFDLTTNTYISCASFEYVATSNLPGFRQSTVDTSVYYKPWSAVTINLSSYQGRQIRLEFTTADCTRGAHFGYAYVDVNPGCTSAVTGTQYCVGTPYITLQGPAGYLHYNWTANNFTQQLGTSQAVTLTPPPPNNTTIQLAIEPYTGFGCVDTLYTTIKANPAPTPNAGNDQIICAGTSTTISTPSLPGHSYFWFPINKVGPSQVVSPTTATSYILYETIDTTGCKKQDTVKVTPVPIDTSLRVTGNLIVCSGQRPNVQLQVNTVYTGVRWFMNGSLIPGATSATYIATAPGTYHAVVNNQTCYDTTRDVTIKVSPPPTLAYSMNTPGQCLLNNSFVFNNTSTAPALDSLRYWWTFGDGGTSGIKNPTHSYVAAGTYNVSLITTNNLGCKDTLTKPVNVFPMPSADYNVASQCMPNNSFAFTNASTVSSGTLTYQWTFGDGGTSSATSPSHAFSTPGTYNNTLIAISNNSCRDTVVKPVTLYPKPAPAFTVSTNAQCLKNNSFSFTNASSISGGTITYNWSFGDGGTSTAVSPTHSYTAAGTYTVKLIVTSNNGCKDSLLRTVVVYPQPAPGFTINIGSNCQHTNSFTLSNTSTISSGTMTYAWAFGNGNTSTAANPAVSYAAPGTYNIMLVTTSDQSCRDTIIKTATVYPSTTPAYAINADSQCVQGNSFTFTNSSSVSSGTVSYTWTFGDGGTSAAISPTHSYTAAGTYTVTMVATTNIGCKDTLTKAVTVFPKPVLAFTINNAAQCQTGNSFTFTNTSFISSGVISHYWTFGDGGTSTAVSPSHTYAAPGPYTVKLVTTSNNGCKDSLTKSITVYASPIAAFAASPSQCLNGNSFTFTSSSSIGAGSITSNWTFGDGNTSTATSPTHSYTAAGNYNVKLVVTSNNGCKDSTTHTVTVYDKPTVAFSIGSPVQCSGSGSYTFTNASSISSGTISHYWTFGDGGTSTTVSPSHTYAAPGTYNVKLVVTSNNGCKDSSTQTVTIYAKPAAAFTASPSQCLSGNNFTFTNSSSISAGSISHYWTFGDGGSSTATSPTHAYAVAGTYNVKLVVTSNNGCKDSISQTVTVYAKPAVAFTINSPSPCSGSGSFTFNNSSLITSGSITHYWTFGDGGTSTAVSPSHAYAAPGTYTITLVVTSNNGCKDSTSQTVNVYAKPTAGFTASPSQCLNGNNFTFTNSSSISAGSISHYWTFGDGGSSTATSPTHAYAAAGTYNVKLVVTSNNGCKDSVTQTVTVYAKPAVAFSIVSPVQCSGNTNFSFNNSSSITSGTISHYWTFGDGGTSTAVSPTHTYAASGTYTIKLVVTSNNGCKDSTIQSVTIYAKPAAVFTINNVAQCYGNNNFLFTNASSISTGSISYAWTFGDGFTSSAANPTHSYTAAGTYSVKLIVTSNNGCKDSTTQSITVTPKPQTSFVFNGGGAQCLNGNGFTFTNTSSISSGTLSYFWTLGDGATSTAVNPTHSYSAYGNYIVKLVATSSSGCKDSITTTVTVLAKATAAFNVNTPTQCLGNNNFAFINASSVPGGTLSYNWSFGDGGNSTAVNPSHVYATPGVYNVKLVATTNYGCKDSLTLQVTVNQKSSPSFTSSNAAQCFPNTTFAFTNTSSLSTGSMTYYWSFGDGGTSTATSPTHTYAGVGSYNVQLVVTTNNGCKDSMTNMVVVTPKPTPFFTPNTFAQCVLGNSFTFTNGSTVSYGSMTYNWSFGDGGTSTATSPTHSYATAGIYTVTLIATSNNGCIDSLHKTVTVNSTPAPAFSVNAAGQCVSGNSFSFTNNSTNLTGSMTYLWTFGDGGTSTTVSPTHTYASAGTYTVKLYATSNGCRDSVMQTVTVHPKPVAALVLNTANQCLNGNNFSFTNNSSISLGSMTYSWSFGDGGTSATMNPTHNYATAGTYTVTMIATSNNGCMDSVKQTVVVYAKPAPAFAVNAPSQCLNTNNFSFTNNSSISSGSMTYQWSFGDGGTTTSISPQHAYTAAGTYNVTLLATSNNGCKDSATQTITVSPKPVAALSVSAPNQCLDGNSYTFANNSTLSSGNMSFVWSFGDGTSSSLANPTHSYTAAGTFTVHLLASSNSGCKDSTTAIVTVYPKPAPAFTINLPVQCLKNNSFVLNNTSGISSGSNQYSWNFGDGATTTLTSPTHPYAAAGNYTIHLLVTSDHGCKDSMSLPVTVNASPAATFIVNSSNQCIKDNNFNFTNTSTGNGSSFTSFWSFGDGNTSTATSPSHVYTASGTRIVRLVVTSTNGCMDTANTAISISSNPTATFTFTFPSQCVSNNVYNFVNTSTVTGTNFSYLWTFGDGSSSTAANPSHSYAAVGTYTVTLVATMNGLCKDSVKRFVSVYPPPTAQYNVNNAQQCLQNNSFTFTNTSLPDTVNLRTTWFFGDGDTSRRTNATHTYAAAGTYPIMMVIASPQGCRDTTRGTVQIDAAPVGTVTTSTNTICQGDTAKLTATGGAAYVWYLNGVRIPGATSNIYYATQAGLYTVDLVASQGCKTTINNNVVLKYIPPPVANFTFDKYCQGVITNFTNTSNYINSMPVSFLWQFSDSFTTNVLNPAHMFPGVGTYNVKLTVTPQLCNQLASTKEQAITVEPLERGVRYNPVNALLNVPMQLEARQIGVAYKWAPSTWLNNINVYNPTYIGRQEQEYRILIRKPSGCSVVDTQLVRIFTTMDIVVPKAFSPNHDGSNDYLFPFMIGTGKLVYFKVINRWGVVVFETNEEQPGWDGNYKGVPQPVDGYVWEAEARDNKGSTIRRKGTVTLIR